MNKSGRYIELELKKATRRTVAKMVWGYTSYHSDFIRLRLGVEPSIANYNVFEIKLIQDIHRYSYDVIKYTRPIKLYIDGLSNTLEEILEYTTDSMESVGRVLENYGVWG